jgi:hypothetical protein
MVLGGSNLKTKLGLDFLLNRHSNHLQMTKYCLHLKEEQYTYSNQLTNLETIVYFYFWRSFATWGSGAKTVHLPHGFTLTNTYPTKISNRRCLKYVAFECHAISNGNHLQIGINKKNMLPLDCGGDKCQATIYSWINFTIKQLRTHSHIWINPKNSLRCWIKIIHVIFLSMNKKST